VYLLRFISSPFLRPSAAGKLTFQLDSF
jgi:hypothetical protein